MIPVEFLQEIFEGKVVTLCNSIKNTYSKGEENSVTESTDLCKAINELLPDYVCASVLITHNTDKVLFGVNVDPTIVDGDALNIILDTADVKLTRYNLEIDSKIIDILTGEEIAAYIVEEICSVMDPTTITEVQNILASLIAEKDGTINIKQSVNYTQLLIFGIKDTMKKIASLIYKEEDAIGMLPTPNALEIQYMLSNARENIKNLIFGKEEPVTAPKMGILQWSLMVYDDIETNLRLADEVLTTARTFTGSILEQREIDKTLKCLRRAVSEVLSEGALTRSKTINEANLFKSLKIQGLKSLENDLYEFKLQAKNCVEQEEALYIIRQINTRIGILDDYLATEELSEAQRAKWESIAMAYRELRAELAKKNVSMRKNVGYYVDYDAINKIEG